MRALAAVAAAAAATMGGLATPALAQETPPTAGTPAAEESDGDVETSAGGRITIEAGDRRLDPGQTARFEGRRSPEQPGARVDLEYRRAGGDWRGVDGTTTNANGRYTLSAKPRRSGDFRAVSPQAGGGTLRSDRVEVGVRPRLEIRAREHQLRDRGVVVRGRLRPKDAGRRVVVERLTGKGWDQIAAARTRSDGRYRATWRSPSLGGYKVRTRFNRDESNLRAVEELRGRVNVYREDSASYYGPGLYGNTTACGQTLREGTVGVAHKSIRCGAKIKFHYRGETHRIPVIDRGPYVGDRRWDLTEGARRKLGFPKGVDEIWADR
jgi:5-hydroxyisourate hydrolase-like protein (transthyretin family)